MRVEWIAYAITGMVWLIMAIVLFRWSYRLRPNSYGVFLGLLRVGLMTGATGSYYLVGHATTLTYVLIGVFALSMIDDGKETSWDSQGGDTTDGGTIDPK